VQLSDAFQAGIDWQLLGFHQEGIALLPNNGKDAITNINITGGRDFDSIINLLETQGNVQVISSPRVSTINNQKAVIKVGNDRFFVTSVTTNITPNSSGAPINSSSVGLTPFFGGITLDVTPQISDESDIILQIHPSISTVSDDNRKVDLGNNNILNLPTATSTIRESDSIVRAHNGQVIIIGGLMENNMSEDLQSTPGVNRVPVVGALFRNTKQNSIKTELVILLKPVVTNNDTWSNQLNNTNANFNNLNRGFHFGSRPEVFGMKAEKFSE
jgi:MSHA biogenesis protein MshL